MTDADLLNLIESVIAKRLAGDAYESYGDGQLQYRTTPLTDLYRMRSELQGLARGTPFGLARLNRTRR